MEKIRVTLPLGPVFRGWEGGFGTGKRGFDGGAGVLVCNIHLTPIQNSPTSNPYNSTTSSLFTGLRATTNRVHQVVYGFALKKNIGHIVVE